MIRALSLMVAGLALIALACGDGASPAEKPTPTASPTPAVEQPGGDGFRQFAGLIQDALDRDNGAFFTERIQPTTGVCREEDVRGGIGAAPCDTVGEMYEAFPTGLWHSDGGLMPIDSFEFDPRFQDALPSASDEFGDGIPRVYAVALAEDKAHAIITALRERPEDFAGSGPLRAVRVTAWTFDGDRWRLVSSLVAYVLAEEFLIPCEGATDFLGGDWERYPDPTDPGLGPDRCPFDP